jgi:type II pantothenate kinase
MILGLDIGGTTTKIAGYRKTGVCGVVSVQADDPVASASGALGKFIDEYSMRLTDIETIAITGVGADYLGKELFGIPLKRVPEFTAIGLGGLFLARLDRAVIISMGTGTAIVYAQGRDTKHMGGSGIGGGTLIGLSRYLINSTDFQNIVEVAINGDLGNVDLNISDISRVKLENIPMTATASNFGRHADKATQADLALGLINMVCQSVGVLGVFAAREKNVEQIVLTGKLLKLPQADAIFGRLGKLFNKEFIIPDYAEFCTAVGSAYTITPSAGKEE